MHGEPDREEAGDIGDGDHAAPDNNGIGDSAHSISDHQLDACLQQCTMRKLKNGVKSGQL